ncbi:MAG: hypothetical protein PQJ47_12025 [Sphaerochaetaceae bacterium]|nr:hypothetical protein [Sphaerochaetaceae bacterium]
MKKSVIFPILFLILLLLSGCSSLQALIRSSIEDKPIWVYEPQAGRDQIAFVGTGEASNKALSQVRSYESILSQISQYIGKDINEQYISQLTERQTIEDFELKITREFSKQEGDLYITHYLAVADKAILNSNRSELLVKVESTLQEIAELKKTASAKIRSDDDYRAIVDYLKIAQLAATIIGEEGEKLFTEAIENVLKVIGNLRINYLAEESKNGSFIFTVQRGDRSISSKIKNVPVSISFPSVNGANEPYVDHRKIVTGEEGRAVFTNTNPLADSAGLLSVEIDTSAFLPFYDAVKGEYRAQIQSAVKARSIKVPYTRKMSIDTSNVLIAIGEYSIKGELLPSSYAVNAVADLFDKEGVDFTYVQSLLTDEDELFFELVNERYADATLIYGKVGVDTVTPLSSSYAVSVTGSVSVYDIPSLTVEGTTNEVKAVGTGQTQTDAIEDAFIGFGRISLSLLKRVLYE